MPCMYFSAVQELYHRKSTWKSKSFILCLIMFSLYENAQDNLIPDFVDNVSDVTDTENEVNISAGHD